jgi:hypothetical protein
MPFNGAGQYTPPPAAPYPAVGGTTILASQFNNVINDIATALSNCITRDGQSPATANIPLGGFKLTGVGAPGATNDALTFGTAGTMTTLTASTSVVTPLVTAPAATSLLFDVNGGTGRWLIDTASGNFRTLSDNTQDLGTPSQRIAHVFTPIIDSGTTGSLSLKTNNGTEQFRVAHSTGTIVNLLQAYGSVTTANPQIEAIGTDANIGINFLAKGSQSFTFFGDSGATPQFAVLRTASSNRNITITGSNGGNPTLSTTGGQLSIPVGIVPAFDSGEQAVATNADTNVSHGLGRVPSAWQVILRNKTAELGYSIGDEALVDHETNAGVYVSSTVIGVVFTATPTVMARNTHAQSTITAGNWKVIFRAW